jgi:hypothetical protein
MTLGYGRWMSRAVGVGGRRKVRPSPPSPECSSLPSELEGFTTRRGGGEERDKEGEEGEGEGGRGQKGPPRQT